MKNKKEIIFKKIKEKGLIFSHQQEITLLDGSKGKWIFDLRSVLLDSEALDVIAKIFWDSFESEYPFQIGGMGIGAISLISAIQMEGQRRAFHTNGFIVRKERKNTGLCKIIEGKINNQKIIIVDDLINSGSSLKKLQSNLSSENNKIGRFFSIVDFENSKAHEWLKKEKIEFTSLFKLSEFNLQILSNFVRHTKEIYIEWVFSAPNPNYFYVVPKSNPVCDDEKIYFGTDAGIFYALDQKTGEINWKYQTGNKEKGIFSSPAIHERVIYFGGYDGNGYALDTDTGKEVWKFTEADFIGSSPAIAPEINLLFIGLEHQIQNKKGSLAALDMKTGEKIWEYIVSEYLHGSPAYLSSKKLVAIGTNDSIVYLFKAETGRLLWSFQTGGPIKASLCFEEKSNILIFGSFDGGCYGVALDSGKEVFRINTDNEIYSTPLVVDNYLYFTSTDKCFYMYDLTKKKLCTKVSTNGKIYSSPKSIKKNIYFGSNDGIIREFNPQTRETTLIAHMSDKITGNIIINNNTYYATTYDNKLFAFSVKDNQN